MIRVQTFLKVSGISLGALFLWLAKDLLEEFVFQPIVTICKKTLFSISISHNAKGLSDINTAIAAYDFTIWHAILVLIILFLIYFLITKNQTKSIHTSITRNVSERDKVTEYCRKFVDDVDYAECVQIYEYTCKCKGKQEHISIRYLYGAIYNGVNMNAIMQENYTMPKDIYDDVRKFSNQCNDAYDRMGQIPQHLKDDGNALIGRIQAQLERVQASKITDEDCCLYQILRMVRDDIVHDYSYWVLTDDLRELEKALSQKKRTGVLPSVFMNNARMFRNNAGGFKNNRVYFTFRAEDPSAHRTIALFAVDGTYAEESSNWDYIAFDISDRFSAIVTGKPVVRTQQAGAYILAGGGEK